jgi:integrase/recombinase XerD
VADDPKPAGAVVPLSVERNPFTVYMNSLNSPHSKRNMGGHLRRLKGMLGKPLEQCTPADVTSLYARLNAEPYTPNTKNIHLAAWRRYMKVADRMDLIPDRHVMLELEALKPFKGSRIPRGRQLSVGEIDALFAKCDLLEPLQARDAAMLILMRAGLRRAEVCDANCQDIRWNGDFIRVVGKGDKERIVPLPHGSRRYLLAWLVHRGMADGPLIALGNTWEEGWQTRLKRMDTSTVYYRLHKLWAKTGFAKSNRPTPHDFRRTLATELLDKCNNPRVAQQVLGHASVETTVRYDRGPSDRMRAAMDLIMVSEGKKGAPDAPK